MNNIVMNRQDACSTRKLIFCGTGFPACSTKIFIYCGTGILPVADSGGRSRLEPIQKYTVAQPE
ncbi:MAG: hypothetical protein QQW96_22475 [Tychonema bourrellyi B0820]|nr:hypothetical protein [Tychonema bourrellyi B0820]